MSFRYCENGSLHSISKNFGRFPENLVGLYMSQVLGGLLYLHEQGVIHRDIKGANILTTKQGLVKLADFGVASRTTGIHESSVVGTPYWMPPEVIELTGASSASDIWSLGCTVIELLEGKPPYYKFQPMQALFRIVNDDHPPLPQGASPVSSITLYSLIPADLVQAVKDFLMQCFQKDPNLRVSARKLLKHPWIVNARRSDSVVPTKSTEYEEAVKSVQEWNEALKSPGAPSSKKTLRLDYNISIPMPKERGLAVSGREKESFLTSTKDAEKFRSPDDEDDNWDDDFASAISPSALQLPHLRPHDNFAGAFSPQKLKAFASYDGQSDTNNVMDRDVTLKNMSTQPDPLETIRPTSRPPSEHDISPTKHIRRRTRISSIPGFNTNPIVAPAPSAPPKAVRPTSFYQESSVEDYSDLIADSDFDKKLAFMPVRILLLMLQEKKS